MQICLVQVEYVIICTVMQHRRGLEIHIYFITWSTLMELIINYWSSYCVGFAGIPCSLAWNGQDLSTQSTQIITIQIPVPACSRRRLYMPKWLQIRLCSWQQRLDRLNSEIFLNFRKECCMLYSKEWFKVRIPSLFI